jgi:hypothetical protein
MRNFCIAAATILLAGATAALAQSSSPNGVKTLAPEGAIKTTGTWDVGTRAGDFVFVAGMRGIDPKTNTLVRVIFHVPLTFIFLSQATHRGACRAD